jgi:hypothetical protein
MEKTMERVKGIGLTKYRKGEQKQRGGGGEREGVGAGGRNDPSLVCTYE